MEVWGALWALCAALNFAVAINRRGGSVGTTVASWCCALISVWMMALAFASLLASWVGEAMQGGAP
jgi:hypothetical protein